ncbi:MAG: PAS domain-containing sensor histidine kinase [Chloroflexi bacterium]|nr:PAS domain-containing sensor histidine kinase [Chloroflexota bacterium]|tara:strand:- start:5699 stop:7084 length:1386 start_codon:yes stop_codon:yes gene_type:complete
MRVPLSFHWRLALAYTVSMLVVFGAAGAYLIASRSSNDEIGRAIGTVIAVGVASIALGLALAAALSRRATSSMQYVTEGARTFAEGDLEHRIASPSRDEAREAANAFNQMAATLQDMVSNLSSERNRLSAVLDTMPDGVIVTAEDGTVELVNHAAEWLLDRPFQREQGVQLSDIVRYNEVLQVVEDALSARVIRQIEFEINKGLRYLSAIATPVSARGNRSVVLTLHDLTRLRQVDTTRREFVSNVSHELRSPLAAIKALAETIQDGALEEPDAARDFLRRIEGEADRMTIMVNELLELSRLQSGQAPMNLVPMKLATVVDDVKSRFDLQAGPKCLSLKTSLPASLPYVMGDHDKLSQVLGNLVENGVKFTPEGGSIAVSATAHADVVEVRVSDTGVGILAEHLPHVFERFYKADRSRREVGTGLGLAIVKHLVQAHGGDIRAESHEGRGATFIFTLDRAS